MTDREAETEAIVAELEKAGLVEVTTNDEGEVAYRLTPKGTGSRRLKLMAGDKDEVLAAPVEAAERV